MALIAIAVSTFKFSPENEIKEWNEAVLIKYRLCSFVFGGKYHYNIESL